MELTDHSKNKLRETFANWGVDKEFADPMYNYLVHGFHPGGCFTSVLANDFHMAMTRSHPANTVTAFKALAGWIHDTVPSNAHGSYEAVKHWLDLNEADRRRILEEHNLIYTPNDEVYLILKDVPTHDPLIF